MSNLTIGNVLVHNGYENMLIKGNPHSYNLDIESTYFTSRSYIIINNKMNSFRIKHAKVVTCHVPNSSNCLVVILKFCFKVESQIDESIVHLKSFNRES
jgi:hypothetical protein